MAAKSHVFFLFFLFKHHDQQSVLSRSIDLSFSQKTKDLSLFFWSTRRRPKTTIMHIFFIKVPLKTTSLSLGRHPTHRPLHKKSPLYAYTFYYNHHVCCFDFIHVRRRESFRRENDHRLQESGVLRSSERGRTEEGTNSESRFFSLFLRL